MKTMVCFRTSQGRFALPVESTLSIRTIEGMVDLPAPRADIAGVLPGDPPLSVLSALGSGGDRVVVVVADDVRFGLQVLEVIGVRKYDDNTIGPPPNGQDGNLISGTLEGRDAITLVADAQALALRL
jgi:chemotaxis signal transduction protein